MGWEAVEQSASTERENNYLTPPLHSNTAPQRQHLGVNRGGMYRRGLLEPHQGEAIIVRMKEDRSTIMPTLDDMLWDSWGA
jgi:hypothetical protein